MFGAFERMVAMRYLRARRQEGFVSVIATFSLLGICLGVATLIIVMSVMNGFRAELLQRILGLNGHLAVAASSGSFTDFDRMAGEIRRIPGVVAVTPIVEGQVLATGPNTASGAIVRGIRAEDFERRPILSTSLKMGSLEGLETDGIVIGLRLARRLGVTTGDNLTLISPHGSASPFGTLPRARAYPIIGLFEIGMFEYDNAFIYMALPAAQTFFRMPNAVSSLDIVVERPDLLRDMRRRVEQIVGQARIFDWRQANASFFNALEVERNVMFLILTLIILVAAFNIISGMIMLVKDKGRDIAILRTMGATRGAVLRIFFLSGASIGVMGTVAGLVLGLVFCDNIEAIRQWLQGLTGTNLFSPEIYFLSQLPAKVDPREVMTVVLMSLGLSFLATVYPSWRAARLDPVEALRYE
jgi:lipoprotein-releasing system permease protein